MEIPHKPTIRACSVYTCLKIVFLRRGGVYTVMPALQDSRCGFQSGVFIALIALFKYNPLNYTAVFQLGFLATGRTSANYLFYRHLLMSVINPYKQIVDRPILAYIGNQLSCIEIDNVFRLVHGTYEHDSFL
jgi:hypothetical protein